MKHIFLFIGIICICSAISCKDSSRTERQVPKQTNTNNAILNFETHKIDMGNIPVNDTNRIAVFNFINKGKSPLLILKLIPSCHCTVAEYPQKPIKPEESGQIKVKFLAEAFFLKTCNGRCEFNL